MSVLDIISIVALIASGVFIAPVFIALAGAIWTDHWAPMFRREREPGLTFEHLKKPPGESP